VLEAVSAWAQPSDNTSFKTLNLTSGSIEIAGSSGYADLEIPVRGSRGKATIYAVARKSAGIWKFETLDVAFDEASPRVSLLQEESNTSNP
jgi:cytochrome oxidase complex assembly protein 1